MSPIYDSDRMHDDIAIEAVKKEDTLETPKMIPEVPVLSVDLNTYQLQNGVKGESDAN